MHTDPYLELYNASARAVKDVHPSLQIGGPASAGLEYIQDFVEDTKRMGIPVDFVSTHSYPSDGYCSSTPDPDCFTKKLLETREIAQKGASACLTAHPPTHPNKRSCGANQKGNGTAETKHQRRMIFYLGVCGGGGWVMQRSSWVWCLLVCAA